jgi:hypothetical protein
VLRENPLSAVLQLRARREAKPPKSAVRFCWVAAWVPWLIHLETDPQGSPYLIDQPLTWIVLALMNFSADTRSDKSDAELAGDVAGKGVVTPATVPLQTKCLIQNPNTLQQQAFQIYKISACLHRCLNALKPRLVCTIKPVEQWPGGRAIGNSQACNKAPL